MDIDTIVFCVITHGCDTLEEIHNIIRVNRAAYRAWETTPCVEVAEVEHGYPQVYSYRGRLKSGECYYHDEEYVHGRYDYGRYRVVETARICPWELTVYIQDNIKYIYGDYPNMRPGDATPEDVFVGLHFAPPSEYTMVETCTELREHRIQVNFVNGGQFLVYYETGYFEPFVVENFVKSCKEKHNSLPRITHRAFF